MSKPQKSSRELMGWLWQGYLRHHMGMLAIAVMFMLLEGSMVGAVSYMMQPMFDLVFVAGNTSALGWVSVTFLVIFCVRGFAGMFQKVLLTRISQQTAASTFSSTRHAPSSSSRLPHINLDNEPVDTPVLGQPGH